jgi:hypothetical protein
LKYEEKNKELEEIIKHDPKLRDYRNGFLNEFDFVFTKAQNYSPPNEKE